MQKRSIRKLVVSAGVGTGIAMGHVVVVNTFDDVDLLPKVSIPSTATGGAEAPIIMADKWVSTAPAPDMRGRNVIATMRSV